MDDNKGWIKVFRQLRDCWVWKTKPFSKGQAWIDLLLKANHKDTKILFNGNLTTIKRGQILTSIRKLVDEWGWSKNTVTKFLNLLEDDGMLTRESDNHRTLITIENYSVFQCVEDTESPQNDTHPNPHSNPQGSHTLTTNKNDKNDKNVNNNISSSLHSVVDAWNSLSEYGIKSISKLTSGTKRYDNLVARLKKYGLDDVIKAIENIKHSDFLQGNTGNWFITFDWFVKPNNFPKVLEGNYNNTNPKPQQTTTDLDPQITAQLRALEEQQMASMPDVANMSDEDIDKLIRGEL